MSKSRWLKPVRAAAIGEAAGGFGGALADNQRGVAVLCFVAWVAAVVWEWRS
jgi:hypothetical protein